MVLVVAGLIVGFWILSRLVEFLFTVVAGLVTVGAVVALAVLGGAIFGWPGALGVLGVAAFLWWRAGSGRSLPPPREKYGYGPGQAMPPSPRRPDGSLY
jgi:hypothetical protein